MNPNNPIFFVQNYDTQMVDILYYLCIVLYCIWNRQLRNYTNDIPLPDGYGNITVINLFTYLNFRKISIPMSIMHEIKNRALIPGMKQRIVDHDSPLCFRRSKETTPSTKISLSLMTCAKKAIKLIKM